MKKDLQIQGVETKTSKNGRKYQSYQTSEGKMSCFEDNVVNKLNPSVGLWVSVEVEERNGFKNITAFYEAGQKAEQVEEIRIAPSPQAPAKQTDVKKPEEHAFKVTIKQSSKGRAYFEVSVKSHSNTDLRERLKSTLDLAKEYCKEINDALPKMEVKEWDKKDYVITKDSS